MKLYFIYDPSKDKVVNGGDRKHAGYMSFKTAEVYLRMIRERGYYGPTEWRDQLRIVEVEVK